MSIAAQIREARGRLGWSQATLARRAGVGRRTIQRAEAGDLPAGPQLQRITDALGSPLVFTPTQQETR